MSDIESQHTPTKNETEFRLGKRNQFLSRHSVHVEFGLVFAWTFPNTALPTIFSHDGRCGDVAWFGPLPLQIWGAGRTTLSQ